MWARAVGVGAQERVGWEARLRTCGVFTFHQVSVKLDRHQPLRIVPFGDVHRFSPACFLPAWNAFLDEEKEAIKSGQKTLYLGMGDYDDLASTSEREILANKGLHESTQSTINEQATLRVKALAKELAFMRGRTIGLVGGNHYWILDSGINTDQLLAQELGTHFLGAATVVALSIEVAGGNRIRMVICAHHGVGRGRKLGAAINRVEDLHEVFPEADLYLMGDNHKRGALPDERLRLRGVGATRSLGYRKVWYGRTGSFQIGYSPRDPHKITRRAIAADEGSYVVDRLLRPSNLGVIRFNVTPKHTSEGSIELDIKHEG